MDNGLTIPYCFWFVQEDGEGGDSRRMEVPVQTFEVMSSGENTVS
jgi:hypothetical protein